MSIASSGLLSRRLLMNVYTRTSLAPVRPKFILGYVLQRRLGAPACRRFGFWRRQATTHERHQQLMIAASPITRPPRHKNPPTKINCARGAAHAHTHGVCQHLILMPRNHAKCSPIPSAAPPIAKFPTSDFIFCHLHSGRSLSAGERL